MKDEVDSEDFGQYSDWEVDQTPEESEVLEPKKSLVRKRGRPRKIPQISDNGNTDSDNDDPSWEAGEKKIVSKPASGRKRGRPRKIPEVGEDDMEDTDNDDPVDVKVKKDINSELVENGVKKKTRGPKKAKWANTILCPNCGQEFHRNPKKGGFPG